MHLPKSECALLGKDDCSNTHIQKSGRRNRRENVRYPHAAHSVRKTYVFVRLAGDVLWIRQGCTLQSPRKVVYPMRSDSIFVGPLAKSNEFHKPMLQPCSSGHHSLPNCVDSKCGQQVCHLTRVWCDTMSGRRHCRLCRV